MIQLEKDGTLRAVSSEKTAHLEHLIYTTKKAKRLGTKNTHKDEKDATASRLTANDLTSEQTRVRIAIFNKTIAF